LEEGAGVVTMVEFHFGELFPRVGFIVTGSSVHSRSAGKSKRKFLVMPILAHRRGPQESIAFVRLGTHRGRHNPERIDACNPKQNQVIWLDR
jgi:hypothetical protein